MNESVDGIDWFIDFLNYLLLNFMWVTGTEESESFTERKAKEGEGK